MKHQLETELEYWLQKQVRVYDVALPIASELSDNYDLSESSQRKMQELNEQMLTAKQLEAESCEVRQQWQQSADRTNEVISNLLDKLQVQLKSLIDACDKIEKRAAACKRNLTPAVNQVVAIRKTRDAYIGQ